MSETKISQKDLLRIIESSPDLYLILDAHLNIVEVSNKYLEATLVKREEILGKGIFDVFPDNPADPNATGVTNLYASLKRVLTLKKPDTMAVQKYDIRRPGNGHKIFEERYWSPLNTPVLDHNNEVKYIIHRVKDVTEFVKLKAEERKYTHITERLVANTEIMGLDILFRARELQELNQELRLAQEKAKLLVQQAEADNRAKSIFLATMSHEIRTSLNGVIGMTELLLDTILSTQQLEYAQTIRISGEALLSVINNVLDYSKIESGNFQLDNIEFELQSILDQTIEIIIGQAHRKQIEIGFVIEPNVPEWCIGDAARLRQVLNNLICNAVKFTNQGEIVIRIKLKEKRGDNLTLLFEVSDTGVGMDNEALQRLFRPFTQASAHTAVQYGGTGLGLCISKQLVELMGGCIEVESKPDLGTTFYFTIKLKAAKATFPSSYRAISEFERMRVLCVDDSAINCKILKELLTTWGIRCDVTQSSEEFINMLVSAIDLGDPYTLALIDDCMPNITGIDLIKIIRQLKEISQTFIILMLSLRVPFSQSIFAEYGVKEYITKPIHPKRLYNHLIKLISNKPITEYKQKTVPVKQAQLNAQILLVEDNFINQQICTGILNKFGLKADIATSGLEAIEAYRKKDYDLILMDCQMPGMDGYEATKTIRKLEKVLNVHVPIIAMTAHALKGDKEKCIISGMDDYISKPIIVKKMNELLNKWLSSDRA